MLEAEAQQSSRNVKVEVSNSSDGKAATVATPKTPQGLEARLHLKKGGESWCGRLRQVSNLTSEKYDWTCEL